MSSNKSIEYIERAIREKLAKTKYPESLKERIIAASFDDGLHVKQSTMKRAIELAAEEVERLQAENAQLRAVIDAVEYVDGKCPWCGRNVPPRLGNPSSYGSPESYQAAVFYGENYSRHTDDCPRQAALKGGEK